MKIHVMHVPGADPHRDAIVRALREENPDTTCVHEDPARRGCMATWLRALGCAASDPAPTEWVGIVSDDAAPLPGWQDELAEATTHSPALYLGPTHFGTYGQQALDKGAVYGVGRHLLWGGAIVYHHTVLRPLYAWVMAVTSAIDYPHDDCLVMEFARLREEDTAFTARAIFDQPVVRSLLNHNTKVRVPATTIANIEGPPFRDATTRRMNRPLPSYAPDLRGIGVPV